MADEPSYAPPPPPASAPPPADLSLAPPLIQAPSGTLPGAPPLPTQAAPQMPPQMPQAPLPPYAAPSAPAAPYGTAPQSSQYAPHPQGGYAGPGTQSYYPQPPRSSGGGSKGAMIAIIAGISVAVLAAILFVIVTVIGTGSPSTGSGPGVAPPSAAPVAPGPSSDPVESEPVDDTAGAEIATRLEAKIDEYKRGRDSGSLWSTIPDTDFNQTAVSAFLYALTDMKAATIWGIDEATAQEYASEMERLEGLLLAEEPLGMDIEIVLSDRTFRYDGETGEGGYFDE